MKKLIFLIGFIFLSSFAFAQEYDDMYFTKKDRKRAKVTYESNRKHINPEYIARYTSKPKVKVQVRSYHTPYRINYWTRYNWNISFRYNYGYYPYSWNDPFYYGYDYYSWYPYHYNSFFMRHNYYSWYPYHYNYYSWHRPYYGWNHYNYGYNHYHTKTYVTKQKKQVNYQKRRTDRSSIHVPTKQRVTNNRVTRDSRNVRIPERTTKKSNSSSRIDWFNSPTKRSTQYRSNSNTKYTPSKSYRGSRNSSSYSTPSRSRSSSSYTPRSNSGGRSYSSGSSGSRSSSGGSRRGGRQ